jgi:beta-lactamase class A
MQNLDRRSVFSAAAGAAAFAATPAALAAGDQPAIRGALLQFLELPGNKSYQIDVGNHGRIFRTSYKSARVRFVGSAGKTFILAKFLQDVEEGRLDENELVDVSDDVRSLSSPVLLNLTGQQGGRYVLEAMIAHSDNTATDIALKQVCASSSGYPASSPSAFPTPHGEPSPISRAHRRAWTKAGRGCWGTATTSSRTTGVR